jgi:nucleoside-diphosphate-sugar epimerase
VDLSLLRAGSILVTGAGGFIGHHLVRRLKDLGCRVRGADIKPPQFEPTAADDFLLTDLREPANCLEACRGVVHVYHLAADMGGIGYITQYLADIARNNALINVHMLEAARQCGVRRFLFTSSACVYPRALQDADTAPMLREEQALPADPEPGYGWEKLFAEQLCAYYNADHGLAVRIARLHNVYGPLGTYTGGKEKAPAAICRKVCEAENGGEIEVWGDGNQHRSFLYVDDCVEALLHLMSSGHVQPLNIGSEEVVTIHQLVDLVCEVAQKRLHKRYDASQPQGVRARNCDGSRAHAVLGWQPRVPLAAGLASTYAWIGEELRKAARLSKAAGVTA